MGDLVPHRVGDDLFKFDRVASHAFVRTLVNRDPIRHPKTLPDRAVRERHALIQPQQSRARRLAFHDDRDILKTATEPRWNPTQRTFYDFVELLRRQILWCHFRRARLRFAA